MKNYRIIILFANVSILMLFTANFSYSQSISVPDMNMDVFWDFYSNNRLSTVNAGKGYTGIASENDISGIILNPASLNLDKKLQVHAEYVYKTRVPWLQRFWMPGFSKWYLESLHPSLASGGAYRINKYFQAGLFYYTANSRKLNFGTVFVINEFGQEVNRYDTYMNMSISSIALPLVVNYKNKLKAGVSLLYSLYHGSNNFITTIQSPDGVEGKVNFAKFNAQFGVIVSPIKDFSLGVTFTPKVEENVTWELSDGTEFHNNTPNVFPMKIGIGLEYRFRNLPLKIDFDYNYVNTSKQEGLKDRHDFHFGTEFRIIKNVSVRAGFFTLKDFRDEGNYIYIDPLGEYDEYFLTLGGTFRHKNFSASIALLDSHILSKGVIKQTVINGGLTLDF